MELWYWAVHVQHLSGPGLGVKLDRHVVNVVERYRASRVPDP